MGDRYHCFADLAKSEIEGRHYRIHVQDLESPILFLAPHGGFIEPATLEIARDLSGARFSFYGFEALEKRARGASLHITSKNFDEPRALALLNSAQIAVTIHGRKDKDDETSVWIGGLHESLRDRMTGLLTQGGVEAKVITDGHPLCGRDPNNICNRARQGAGVQIEMPARSRQQYMRDASFQRDFVTALHRALDHEIKLAL